MTKFTDKNFYMALFIIFILTLLAKLIASFDFFSNLGLSLLIISILLGMIITNVFKLKFEKKYDEAIGFCTKELLRMAIVFYGFRLTFADINNIGIQGILMSMIIVASTFILGYFIWVKILKLDKQIVILTSAGSSICGAAAVLATEAVLKNKAYKSAIAVSTVVLFGTISMFLYPILLKIDFLNLTQSAKALYIGGTLHEVAHVIGAANSFSNEIISNNSVVVKMLRVILLAPFLILLSLSVRKENKNEKTKITIPWFAIFFIIIIALNSQIDLDKELINLINKFDTFFLAMAMMALGLKTDFKSIKNVGIKPLILALILSLYLLIVGFLLAKILI